MVPRDAHAQFDPAPGRDPLGLLERQAQTRVSSLVPIRYGRMAVSPFTFFRGAALPMAADLATTPTTDLYAQLCGDAHLSNFGVFGTPERQLVFDVNDFDETLPGPFEWDVKRLAASIVVAGRANGFDEKATRATVMTTVASYRSAIRALAGLPVLDVWYLSENVDKELATLQAASSSWSKKQRATLAQTASALDKARRKDNTRAAQKLTVMTADGPRLINDPPLIVPIAELLDGSPDSVTPLLHRLVAKYRTTLRRDRQRLLDHFSLVDIAHKVVGVGSVGTRAWVLLMLNADHDETLILQAKEAEPSVLAQFVQPVKYAQQGQRVVTGQLAMQSSSDIFLGWLRAPPRQRLRRRLLRPAAVGLEGLCRSRNPATQRHDHLRSAVRADPGARTRPQWEPNRDRRLPRWFGRVRPGGDRVRRAIRESDRGRPRGAGLGDQLDATQRRARSVRAPRPLPACNAAGRGRFTLRTRGTPSGRARIVRPTRDPDASPDQSSESSSEGAT